MTSLGQQKSIGIKTVYVKADIDYSKNILSQQK